MDSFNSADILLFEGFRFDRLGGGLFRIHQQGPSTHVPLGWRALDLLGLLAGQVGKLLLKDAIMQAVWPGKIVEEANLNVQISKLRRILDHGRPHGSCIQTITGYGYRFAVPVIRIDPSVPPAPATPNTHTGGDVTEQAVWGETATPQHRLMLTVLCGLARFEQDVGQRRPGEMSQPRASCHHTTA